MSKPRLVANAVDPSVAQWKAREIPTVFNDRYNEQDKLDTAEIVIWLNKNKRTSAFLGNASSINKAMVTGLLNGNYDGKITPNLKKLIQTIRHIDARNNESCFTPFVETSVSRLVNTACRQARISKMFSVVGASVGTGKTRSAKDVTREHNNTWMIEAWPGMNFACLLDRLVEEMHIGVTKAYRYMNSQRRFGMVIDHVRRIEDGLIILDEAEKVQEKSLEALRRLSDLGGIGILLIGTTDLYQLIKPEGGQFDQIRSRTTFFPEPIFHITKDDARAIIQVSFADRPEILNEDDELLPELFDAFWELTEGSMRMLVDGLIPAIMRYGIPQHGAVTPDVVLAVAKTALNLTPKKKR